jgi:hypothetical protein
LSRGIALLSVTFLLGACSLVPAKNYSQPVVLASVDAPSGADPDVMRYREGRAAGAAHEVPRLPEPDLTVTPEVERQLASFKKGRRFIERSLLKREEYLPVIREIFAEEGVPEDLINVALIESGFNKDARSYAGAVGMWQFMKSTGRSYGLEVSRKVDDRKNVVDSTIAAARHLRDLYGIFGDWYLALAAYNAGIGGVSRAITRAGSSDFWVVAKKGRLKRQTIEYVPRFIAATIIVNDLEGHGFTALAQNLESMRLAKNGAIAGDGSERASYRAR